MSRDGLGGKINVAELSSLRRRFLVLLFCFFALSSLTSETHALPDPIQLGDDPSRDADPASVDILKVSMMNNGTHLTFIIECRSAPAPSSVRTYRIWLDTNENGGATTGPYIGADWYIQGGGAPGLYDCSGEESADTSTYKASIEVKVYGKSICLTAGLSDIGYPGNVKETVGIVASTHQPAAMLKDRTPDTGHYSVVHEVIPELPWPTPLVIMPAIVAAIIMIYRQRFRHSDQPRLRR